tara:strand:+ start:7772 stop:8995 length:1224 start_codon:yes stop_codon:yes gene_type:complete
MKKIAILSVLFLLVVSLTQAAVYSNQPEIRVIILSQSPDPVEPGQVVTMTFQVDNEGQETSGDVIVEILPQYPFSLYSGTAQRNIGVLRRTTSGDKVTVEYKLKVDEEAAEGETEIELQLQVGDTSGRIYSDDEFLIDIQTQDAVLGITSITSEPEQIPPGGMSSTNIMVKNFADSLLKDIKFTLDFRDSTLPLAPFQSSSQQRLAKLRSDFQGGLEFNIQADPNAAPGLYKVPLNITYNDEKGNSYAINDVLPLTIGDIPELNTYIKKTTVLQPNKDGKVTIEIANAGTTDVKYMSLTLLPSEHYTLISPTNYFYIGDIDRDDTESEEIDIFTSSLRTLRIPVELQYKDASNTELTQQVNLEMDLYSALQLRKLGVLERTKLGLYGTLLIIGGAGYLVYRRRKKNA